MVSPRIGVVSIVQETNTFSPKPTTWDDYTVMVGWSAVESLGGTNTEFAGAMTALQDHGVEAVPVVAIWALPSGPVTDEAFGRLLSLLDRELRRAGRLDGLVMSLHGALVTESDYDADSSLIKAARGRVGGLPLGVCLDLHANVTEAMAAEADIMVGYHTEPHVDMASTGRRIARLVQRTVQGDISPTMALAKRPMLVPAEGMRTDTGPMSEVRLLADRITGDTVHDVSLFPVQPWLDVPELGLGVLVVTDRDPAAAREVAEEMATEVWNRRQRMVTPRLLPPLEAFEAARRSSRPFLMAHTADCPTAGAPGDDPRLITEAKRHAPDLVVFHSVLDPDVARKCRGREGDPVSMPVGGALSPEVASVDLAGTVARSGAGTYPLTGRSFTGRKVSMGEWAVITSGNHHLLVTSVPAITADPSTWAYAGLDPDQADVLIVRSCSDYRANFPDSAPEAVTLDVPGPSTPRLENLVFRRAPRPLYPVDRGVS